MNRQTIVDIVLINHRTQTIPANHRHPHETIDRYPKWKPQKTEHFRTDGRSSDYHTYCDADNLRMSSTTKLFHPQTQGQLTKYSSNKIYNSKMSTNQNTNSNNSTSPLITRGQQLLLSSNEEDDDEDTSQIQLSTKRPSCSSQLTNSSAANGSNQTGAQHPTTNFTATSQRSSLTGGTLYPSQPYSQTESQPNYYGQVMASTSAASRFLERQSSYRPQSTLGSFGTLNHKASGLAIEQDHHYYEPMFSSNRIYQQSELPPLPPERNHQTNLSNFSDTGLRASLQSANNFATLHHPQHYLLSNSVQPPHMTANYNTLNLGKHTVISNLTASSTNLQHLNQFYSKKKLHR